MTSVLRVNASNLIGAAADMFREVVSIVRRLSLTTWAARNSARSLVARDGRRIGPLFVVNRRTIDGIFPAHNVACFEIIVRYIAVQCVNSSRKPALLRGDR